MVNAQWLTVIAVFLLASCVSRQERDDMQARLAQMAQWNTDDTVFTARHTAEAQTIADWFDRHGTPNEQLKAHYLLGRTYADRGEAPYALDCYQTAASCADTTAQDCDYRTLSRVHTQMAEIYYYQLLPNNMIREEQRAIRYAKIAKDTMQYLYCYGMLAEGYEMKIQPDSALHLLAEAYKLYNKIGKNQLAASLCCSMAELYRQKKDYPQALRFMKEYEDCSGLFIDSDNVAPGKEMYYSCKAHLCLDTSNREFAEHYFRKLLSVPGASDLRIAALDGLQRYYTKYFNKDSLVKYVSLSDSVCNVVHNDVEMQKTLLVQSMYDYSRNEHIALQKERESEQFRTYLIVLCSITVVIGLLSAIAYIRYRNERQSLEDRIRLLRGYAVNETLYNCPKAQYFRQLLNANPYQTPDNNDWKELSALIDREAPSFRRSLSEKIVMTDFEYDVCMLIKIQIPVSDIARLKHCTPANITKTRKNIYMKLFGKAGRADELDEYLMSLR